MKTIDLTAFEKQRIMYLEEQGYLADEIADKLNKPESVISNYIEQLRFPQIYRV